MCKVISGGLVDCDVIVPIGSDPHLYEPTPADLIKVGQSDLILINGLTFSEGWLAKRFTIPETNVNSLSSARVLDSGSEIYHNGRSLMHDVAAIMQKYSHAAMYT